MNRQVYINLPVKDLERSIAFFSSLGFPFDTRFTDEKATALVINEDAFVMLLVEDYFQTFTPKTVCKAKTCTEVLIALSCESRDEVDELVRKAVSAGGAIPRPAQDLGSMYSHAFEDPDGHIWELGFMEPA